MKENAKSQLGTKMYMGLHLKNCKDFVKVMENLKAKLHQEATLKPKITSEKTVLPQKDDRRGTILLEKNAKDENIDFQDNDQLISNNDQFEERPKDLNLSRTRPKIPLCAFQIRSNNSEDVAQIYMQRKEQMVQQKQHTKNKSEAEEVPFYKNNEDIQDILPTNSIFHFNADPLIVAQISDPDTMITFKSSVEDGAVSIAREILPVKNYRSCADGSNLVINMKLGDLIEAFFNPKDEEALRETVDRIIRYSDRLEVEKENHTKHPIRRSESLGNSVIKTDSEITVTLAQNENDQVSDSKTRMFSGENIKSQVSPIIEKAKSKIDVSADTSTSSRVVLDLNRKTIKGQEGVNNASSTIPSFDATAISLDSTTQASMIWTENKSPISPVFEKVKPKIDVSADTSISTPIVLELNENKIQDQKRLNTSGVTTPSLNGTKQPLDSTTPSLDETAQSLNATIPSLDNTTTLLDNKTASVDTTTSSIDITTPSVDITTQSVDITTPSVDITTPSVDITTPSVDITTPSSDRIAPTFYGTTPSSNDSPNSENGQLNVSNIPNFPATESSDPRITINNRKESPISNEVDGSAQKKHKSSPADENLPEPANPKSFLVNLGLYPTQGQQVYSRNNQPLGNTKEKMPNQVGLNGSDSRRAETTPSSAVLPDIGPTARASTGSSGSQSQKEEKKRYSGLSTMQRKKLVEMMKETWKPKDLSKNDQNLVKKLQKLLGEQGSSSKGNNNNEDLWVTAGLFGTLLLKKVNKLFQFEKAIETLRRERTGKDRHQTKMNWDGVLLSIKKFVNGNIDNNIYKLLKEKFANLKVRKYAGELEHEAVALGEDKSKVVPVKTVIDGRCFYDAITNNFVKETINKSNMPDLLKILLAQDILTNESKYDTVLGQMKNIFTKAELLFMILAPKYWAESFIMECMALFLGREIYSYRRYATVSGPKYTTDCKFGVDNSVRDPVAVAFVGSTKETKKQDHYIALLKRDEKSELPGLKIPKKCHEITVVE